MSRPQRAKIKTAGATKGGAGMRDQSSKHNRRHREASKRRRREALQKDAAKSARRKPRAQRMARLLAEGEKQLKKRKGVR